MRASISTSSLVALALAINLAGCSGESSETLIQQAQQSLKTGDQKAALIQLKSAVQADAENAAARFELGQLQLAMRDYVSAEKELRLARQFGFSADKINPLLARALNGQGEFKRVIDEIPAPTAGSIEESPLLVAIANAQLGTGDKESARKSLARASVVTPKDPEVRLLQARLSLLDSDVPGATRIIEDSLRDSPNHRDTWLLKADLLGATGKPEEARQAYLAALKIDPKLYIARVALANIAIATNQYGEARREVDTVLKASPNHLQARYTLAYIEYQEKKYEAARDQLATVLKYAPDYAPAMLLAGINEYALGNMQTAETHLNKALKVNPKNIYAIRMLAAAKLRQGQPAESARILAAIPLENQDGAYHIVAGETALALKDFAKASNHFEKAIQINPDSAAIRTQLGISRLGQGDSRASADLQAASAMDVHSSRADTVLIVNQLEQGNFDAALASIAQLEKKEGPTPLAMNYRGAAYLGKGNSQKARESFEQALKLNAGFFPAAANLAQLDIQAKQLGQAQSRFESILKADPNNLNAMMAMADMALRNRDGASHMKWLEKAATTHPKALPPRIAMARFLLAKGDKAKALNIASEAYNAQPDSPVSIDLLGTVQLALGDTTNALGSYRKLAERQPGQTTPLIKLATVQIVAKDLAAARKSLLSALQINPRQLDAQQMLGGVEIQSERYDDALAIARKIQQQQPGSPQGHTLEAQAQFARKAYPEALSAYERAFKIAPSGTLLIQQLQVLNTMGKPEEGEQRIAAWLAQKPDDSSARGALAESLLKRQQLKSAIDQYLILNQRTPNNLVVLNNLSWALAEVPDKRALTYAAQAHKLAPDNPSVLDTYGWAYVRLGNPKKGLDFLKQAQAKTPDSPDVQWHLAYALNASGDPARARQELKALLDRRVSFGSEAQAKTLYQQLITR